MKKRRTNSFLSRFKIKNQLFLVFLLAVVIPSLLLGSFIFIQSVNILSSRAYEQLERTTCGPVRCCMTHTVVLYLVPRPFVRPGANRFVVKCL